MRRRERGGKGEIEGERERQRVRAGMKIEARLKLVALFSATLYWRKSV